MKGNAVLKNYQYIQVGGTAEDKFEGGSSGIWWDDNTWVVAGPGGRGGSINASWNRSGGGQNGGCINDTTNSNRYGGSGGGGGTGTTSGTATGGKGLKSPKNPPTGVVSSLQEYYNNGGDTATKFFGRKTYTGGGGGGAGSAGYGGQEKIAGNGGRGRLVTLAGPNRSYLLGGGGGGAAAVGNPGPFVGFGEAGGGDGSWGTNEREYETPGTYVFYVPRNTTSMNLEAIAAGGSGGTGATRGNGGGGSGGYLPSTDFPVQFGQKVTITVGGGVSNQDGQDTRIEISSYGSNPGETIILKGGRVGGSSPTDAPAGGLGGAPNGRQGDNGGQNESPNWVSGAGASSPIGEGGGGIQTTSRDRPGNGGRGAGGGGGCGPAGSSQASRAGGIGGNGFARIRWNGDENQNAQPNTGSGGGGGYDGGGGNGGTGFVVISYPGAPVYTARINGRNVAPLRQNGYTIHEFTSSGELIYQPDVPSGQFDRGNGIEPAGQNNPYYVPGVAYGGVGNDNLDVYPVRSSVYNDFINQYGVWNLDSLSRNFERSYNLYVTKEASYEIQAYADNGATVSIDGGTVIDMTPPDRGGGNYWLTNGLRSTKKLGVGFHTIGINATNLGQRGMFAMTITEAGTQNIIFNSRTPPTPRGSPAGGNGLVVLEFIGGKGAAKIKVDNDWKEVVGQWVKVDNTWRIIRNASTKVNGTWRSLFGELPITVTVDPAGFGGPPVPPTPRPASRGGGGGGGTPGPENPTWANKESKNEGDGGNVNTSPPSDGGGGGGGGGGCKIICQKLAQMGFFDAAMNAADQEFGELLRSNDPDAYNGYIRWAAPVVELLEGGGSSTFRKVVFPWLRDEQARKDLQIKIVAHYLDVIARPWAEEMAYRMQATGYSKSNPAGRMIMDIGLPMCRLVAKFGRGKTMPMWAKTAIIWGTTTVLLAAVTVISTVDKVISKIKNVFKRG
jgi:hypothetical protein